MRTRGFLPISLLSLALAAPVLLPGASPAEAAVKDQKDKQDKQDKNRGQQNRQRDDWNRDWDNDWDRDWDDRDGNMRFKGMDTNKDGRVTRREWRGNARSFEQHDWNRDGVLSGQEVRPGGSRNDPRANGDDDRWDDDRWNDRFEDLDRNNDRYLSASEWPRDARSFDLFDRNNDRRVSLSEFQNRDFDRRDVLEDRFAEMDGNRDGRLSRSEWWGGLTAFERMDRNNDNYLSRTEFLDRDYDGRDNTPDDDRGRFAQMDTNRDGRISRNEWPRGEDSFEQLDRNNDQYLSRSELQDRGWDDRDGDLYPRDDRRFRDLDRNRDSRLSQSEWTGSRDFFDRLDRNNDGWLSLNEWLER